MFRDGTVDCVNTYAHLVARWLTASPDLLSAFASEHSARDPENERDAQTPDEQDVAADSVQRPASLHK